MKLSCYVIAIALGAVAACDSPTGSACPTSNAPTYGSFGEVFFTTYCTGCHSATAADRFGAPGDVNFDTEAEIVMQAGDIDAEAASGPGATNTGMPELIGPVKMAPSTEERVMLGQFLACEEQGK